MNLHSGNSVVSIRKIVKKLFENGKSDFVIRYIKYHTRFDFKHSIRDKCLIYGHWHSRQ